jgi:hypothetical protein
MRETPSTNSTAMSGKAETSRFAKTASLVLLGALVAAAASADVEVLAEVPLAAEEVSVVAVASVVAVWVGVEGSPAVREGYGGAPGGGGPGFEPNAGSNPPNPFTDFAASGGEPSNVIYVRNLPWSTSNEDLVELFTTIGKVERAEIQYEPNGRSRGTGVVEFEKQEDAETAICKFPALSIEQQLTLAIAKFTGYQYGGRPLGLSFVKYTNLGNGDAMEGTEHTGGLTQDQIM